MKPYIAINIVSIIIYTHSRTTFFFYSTLYTFRHFHTTLEGG